MQTLTFSVLVLHIVAGYIALTAGLFSMAAAKGRTLHRRAGRLFFISMLGVTASSIFLAVAKSNDFLLFVGIFVFFQNYSGWKVLRNKAQHPDWADWAVLAVAFVNAVFMIYSLNIVLLVFGGISLLLVATSLRTYYQLYRGIPLPKLSWLARHIGMMMGAYIGTLTAFLIVNIQFFEPYWVIWLAPTAVFVPLMRFWTWQHTRQRPLVNQ